MKLVSVGNDPIDHIRIIADHVSAELFDILLYNDVIFLLRSNRH